MIEIRNPEWPWGITIPGWLAHELWREYPETGTCKSCGRAAMTAIKGHDGFCPVPFLVTAQARIEALERVRRATEVINTTTHEASKGVYLGKPCAHGNLPVYPTHARWCDECWQELEDALAVLRGEEEP